ncbi:hypothetical protein C1922_02185 [Stenotrophomonas sp. ZAC14D2_NAIMI4_7]|uniref:response regulator n=1 Tax=Stenotrophomonas sp. ZAC14D2_NAIMI4_7 TaxID=2072405 RepID=UPI000D54113E|nr:response regulator [Stenotrophomonas sp. ZAC14D2_NAIMI4_7]AWH16217.1 hypothetical protein C1922_02185 [Stenotrophomonas sp. ZAC14D2_NAIMI4_7]
MKLTYRVLWFDDNADFFNSLDLDYLKGTISSWGFVPDVKFVTTGQEFHAEAPYSDYDLLVVDYHLDGIGEGQDFIANVRDQQVFTEIIFYSSNSTEELWDEVRSNKLEGIFVANRGSIIARVISVGKQSLRKVLDLENMRGIVMAEVGDLDLSIARVVVSSMELLAPEAQSIIFEGFYNAGKEFHGGQLAALENFRAAPTARCMLELCDSNKLWQNFNRVKRHVGALQTITLGDFPTDILRPRNFLAHGLPTILERGVIKFTHREREYIFDEDIGTALRLKIIEYKNHFLNLENILAAGADEAATA